MRIIKRLHMFLTACTVLTVSVFAGFPAQSGSIQAGTILSASDFLKIVNDHSANHFRTETYSVIRFAPAEQCIYRDGIAVGESFQGFCIRNGELLADAAQIGISGEEKRLVSLREAAEKTGAAVYETDDGICVTTPFRSARLIVKSEQTPPLSGAESVTEGYRNLHVLQYRNAEEAFQAYQKLKANPSVQYVEPSCTYAAAGALRNPADAPAFEQAWGVADIGADEYCTWLRGLGRELPEIKVAVIDTGINTGHFLFKDRIAAGGTGFVPDSNASYEDDNGHGSHCSGIICQSTPENVRILPLKVLNAAGYAESLEVYCAMMYALEQGADVVSMSLGGTGESPLIDEASQALRDADIPCCVSAGNESRDTMYCHPASNHANITVSAIDAAHQAASFSNFGDAVDFCAPGVGVNSAYFGSSDRMKVMDGTSMATPFVSAAFANLLSFDPDFTYEEMYQILRENAVDLGETGRDSQYGWGEISLSYPIISGVICDSPVFSVPGGSYDSAFDLTMNCKTADAKIYYTLNNSEPSPAQGILWDGTPLHIEHSVILRAAAVSGEAVSEPVKAVYIIDGEDVPDALEIADGVLVAYHGAMSTLNLKEQLAGQSVSAIGDDAFAGHTELKSITIPDTVTQIGDCAFSGCENLKTVIAEQVTEIGNQAFMNCTRLTETDFSPLERVGKEAFRSCIQLRGLKNGFADSFTDIPDGLFADCSTLTTVMLPDIRTIGREAFRNCTRLRKLTGTGFSWEHITEIGNAAFQNAALSGSLHFSALTALGTYAFADTYIQRVRLPEQITALPDGVFRNDYRLNYLDAAGVVKIGEAALLVKGTDADNRLQTNIPFSAVTFLGASALSGRTFDTPVHFDALTEITPGALTNIQGAALYFPKIKVLQAGAITEPVGSDALYFENLEIIESGAVSGVKGLVAGSSLEALRKSAVSETGFLAAPEGSPLQDYASEHFITFRKTPSLLPVSDAVTEAERYSSVSLKVLPLGFDALNVRWLEETGDSAHLLNCQDGVLFTDTFTDASQRQFRVELYSGTERIDSRSFTVSIHDPVQPVREIAAEEAGILDWQQFSRDSSNLNMEAGYLFRPQRSGQVEIVSSGGWYTLTVCGSDGSRFTVQPDPDTTLTIPLTVQQGNTYSLRFEISSLYLDDSSALTDCMTFFRITETLPDAVCDFNDPDESIRIQWDGDAEFPLSADSAPVQPDSFRITQIHGNEQIVLQKGTDYTLAYSDNTAAGTGTVFIIGAGNYIGVMSEPFSINGSLAVGRTIPINTSEPVKLFFTAPETASYQIYTDFPDYFPEWFMDSGLTDIDELAADIAVTAADSSGQPVDVSNPANHIPSAVRVSMKKGETYTLTVSEMRDDNKIGTLFVSVLPDTKVLSEFEWSVDESDCVFTGTPLTPAVRCSDNLKAGTDYSVEYFGNNSPGTMLIAINSAGKYSGRMFLTANVTGQTNSVGEYVMDRLSPEELVYTFQPAVSGSYSLMTDWSSALYDAAVAADDTDSFILNDTADTVIALRTDDGRLLAENDDTRGMFSSVTVKLEAGKAYQIAVRAYDKPPADVSLYIALGRNLSENTSTSFDKEYEYQGEPVRMQPTVISGTKKLKEGVDYTLRCIGSSRPGTVCVLIEGIGDYCGRKIIWGQLNPASVMPGKQFTVYPSVYEAKVFLQTHSLVSLAAADGIDAPYECSARYERTGTEIPLSAEPVLLGPGSYTLWFSTDAARSFLFEIHDEYTDLASCTYSADNCIYTGKPVKPHLTVYHDDVLLEEEKDYIVICHEEMVGCGTYEIQVKGIGAYCGSVYLHVSVLVNPELTVLPELKTGVNRIEITQPGQTVYLHWKPEQANYGIIKEDVSYTELTVIRPDGAETGSCGGIGYQSGFAAVSPHEAYLAAVKFRNPEQTGLCTFSVIPNAVSIDAATPVYETMIPYSEANPVPDIRFDYLGAALREGVDYQILRVGGKEHLGKAAVTVRGIGRFVGEMTLNYYIYPENPAEQFELTDELIPNEAKTFLWEKPNQIQLYRLTSDADGSADFYLHTPDESSGCSAFLYDADGTVHPYGEIQHFVLQKGESAYVLCVTDWLEFDDDNTEIELLVTEKMPVYDYYDEEHGTTYRMEGSSAWLTGIDPDMIGVYIPDIIYDADKNIRAEFAGVDVYAFREWNEITSSEMIFLDYLRTRTFYTEPDSYAEWILKALCAAAAYTNPVCSVSGDVTGDGEVHADDALTLLRWLSEASGMHMNDSAYRCADFTGDGMVDLLDVQAILAFAGAEE